LLATCIDRGFRAARGAVSLLRVQAQEEIP
jgi:hypothetical protein